MFEVPELRVTTMSNATATVFGQVNQNGETRDFWTFCRGAGPYGSRLQAGMKVHLEDGFGEVVEVIDRIHTNGQNGNFVWVEIKPL